MLLDDEDAVAVAQEVQVRVEHQQPRLVRDQAQQALVEHRVAHRHVHRTERVVCNSAAQPRELTIRENTTAPTQKVDVSFVPAVHRAGQTDARLLAAAQIDAALPRTNKA